VTVRNPDYWKPGLPYLDGVRLVALPDPQARWSAFLAKQIDLTDVPGTESRRFLAEQSNNYFTEWGPDISVQQIWVNTRKAPFNDPRVYRALRLLVDHTEFITGWVETWFGRGTLQGGSHLPHAMADWDFSEEEYQKADSPLFLEFKQPKDEAAKEALSLLSAAGFTRENPLKFDLSSVTIVWSKPMAELLQAQYRRLSQGVVQAELKLFENNVLIGMQTRGEFDVAGPVARSSYIEPDQLLRQIYYTDGSNNFGKYSDRTLDEMIDRQRALFDLNERRAAVKDIVRYLLEHAPYTGPCSRDQLYAAQPKVKDFRAEATRVPAHQYEHIWFDV
jgi:peptide/nickel transport system substrate-binding protein